ncbi:MAG: ester cyclase [Bryobacteraceae bacterium]|nr:ester cyclase [Bryobacteraceae bacterium]
MHLTLDPAIAAARLRVVDDHIRFECAHELDPLIATFGSEPEQHHVGQEKLHGHDAIRAFYSGLFRGFPDFWLDVQQRHVAHDSVVLEGMLGGTHTGEWMGIKPTGTSIEAPFCAIFTFTDDSRLKTETVYYDRLSVLTQLGTINVPI